MPHHRALPYDCHSCVGVEAMPQHPDPQWQTLRCHMEVRMEMEMVMVVVMARLPLMSLYPMEMMAMAISIVVAIESLLLMHPNETMDSHRFQPF